MITPDDIKKKAERKYVSILQSAVLGSSFERLTIPGNKSYRDASFSDFEKSILKLTSQSKAKKGFGYVIEFKQVKTKHLGLQDLPAQIYFDSLADYLKFIGKEKEAKKAMENYQLITSEFPELTDWAFIKMRKVIQYETEWESLLKVCRYFKNNPRPNLYLRELPVQLHTKFVENHKIVLSELLSCVIPNDIRFNERIFEKRYYLKYSEPLVRFKVLDKTISQQFFSGINDLSIPVSQFEQLDLPLEKVLVVENKTNLYLALTLPPMDNAIVIFGKGYNVQNLKHTKWLHQTNLLYWGDLDAQGFEILSQFRRYFPHTKSILMDGETFDLFFENDEGTPSKVTTPLQLTPEEYALYELLKTNNWRLEQEKLPLEHVRKAFG